MATFQQSLSLPEGEIDLPPIHCAKDHVDALVKRALEEQPWKMEMTHES